MPSFAQMLARLSDIFAAPGRGVPFANRNGFIDGAFDFGSGPTALITGAQYTGATMWLSQAGTGGAGNVSVISARGGPGIPQVLDSSPNNCLQFTMSTANTGSLAARTLPGLWQKIEFVSKYAGKSVTISCKAWCSGGPMVLPGILLTQNFGTGGSPSPVTNFDKAVNWTVTGAVQRFSARVDVPAIPAGVAYGTNNNDFSNFGIWLPSGWTGNLYIAEMQIELCSPNASNDLNGNGGAPTAFEYRGVQAELARVRRFYAPVQTYTVIGNAPFSGWNIYGRAWYSATMRAAPAITWTPAGSSGAGTPSITDNTLDGATPTMQSTAAGNCFFQVTNYVADARL